MGENDKTKLYEKWLNLIVVLFTVVGFLMVILILMLGYMGMSHYSDMRESLNEMASLKEKYQFAIQGAQGTWIEFGKIVIPNPRPEIEPYIATEKLKKTHSLGYALVFQQSDGFTPSQTKVLETFEDSFKVEIIFPIHWASSDTITVDWIAIGSETLQK